MIPQVLFQLEAGRHKLKPLLLRWCHSLTWPGRTDFFGHVMSSCVLLSHPQSCYQMNVVSKKIGRSRSFSHMYFNTTRWCLPCCIPFGGSHLCWMYQSMSRCAVHASWSCGTQCLLEHCCLQMCFWTRLCNQSSLIFCFMLGLHQCCWS